MKGVGQTTLPHQSPDSETLANFYHKGNPGLWETLSENACPAADAIAAFNVVLTTFDSMYDLYMLTDAPSYDASLVNYYLQLHGHLPLLFCRNATRAFRPVHDAHSYARGFLKRGPGEVWVSNSQLIESLGLYMPPTLLRAHMPEDDAEAIYLVLVPCRTRQPRAREKTKTLSEKRLFYSCVLPLSVFSTGSDFSTSTGSMFSVRCSSYRD